MTLYGHTRKDNNEMFYVGIGSKDRPYSRSGRSKSWIEVVNSVGYNVGILLDNVSKEEACYWEKIIISALGKKKNGGILVNISSGGSGHYGAKHSDIAKSKISKALLGRVFTEDHRNKISQSISGVNHHRYGISQDKNCFSKGVVDQGTGVIYPSIKSAAEAIGMKYSTLRCMINGHRYNRTQIKYLNYESNTN